MKAATSSQLAFEPVLVPSLGLAFLEGLLFLLFTKLAKSSSRQERGEATTEQGVSGEVVERKCQDWHPGDLRSREKVGLVYLSSPGFLSLTISPSVLTHAGWKAHTSSPPLVWVLPRPTGPLDKKKLSNPHTPSSRNKHHGRQDDGKSEDREECWETSSSGHDMAGVLTNFPQLRLPAQGHAHKVTRMSSDKQC